MRERIRERFFRKTPSGERILSPEINSPFEPFERLKRSEISDKLEVISPSEMSEGFLKIAETPIVIGNIHGNLHLMAQTRLNELPSTPLGDASIAVNKNSLGKCPISVSATFVLTEHDIKEFEKLKQHKITFRIGGKDCAIDLSEHQDNQKIICSQIGSQGSALITSVLRDQAQRIVLLPSEKAKKIRHLKARIVKTA